MRHPLAASLVLAVALPFSPPARPSESASTPVLDPVRTLAPVVAWAAAGSPTLSRMLEAVATLEGSHLSVSQRLQPNSSMRAHSTLVVRRDDGFRVDGSLLLPPARSRAEIAALLAHEIAHVLALAGVIERQADDPRDERLARSFEDAVRRELQGRKNGARRPMTRIEEPPR